LRFLLDESVSPLVTLRLVAAGHDAVHVHDVGLTSASDPVVLDAAKTADRVLITLDAGFGALIAHSGSLVPSVVLFRGDVTRRPVAQAEVLRANLDQFTRDLEEGAVVVIGDDRIRIRRLPIGES
jgi:predicted nuclease of predicted toxin-antitoxin system